MLDFNLYLSEYDVWVAAIADGGDLGFAEQAGVPHLVVPDTSCTVPYLYGNGIDAGLDFGLQAFLPYAYTGDFEDGGPTDIARASEGYIDIIEMGELTNDDAVEKDELEADVGNARCPYRFRRRGNPRRQRRRRRQRIRRAGRLRTAGRKLDPLCRQRYQAPSAGRLVGGRFRQVQLRR